MARTRTPRTHQLPAGTLAPQQPPVQAPAPQAAPTPQPPTPQQQADETLGHAMAAVVQQLTATMAAQQPAVPAAPQAPVTVALRGGPAIAQVHITTRPYRVTAGHNAAWWAQVQQAVAAGQGTASVQALLGMGVPAPFVGYAVRRGWLAAGPQPQPAAPTA